MKKDWKKYKISEFLIPRKENPEMDKVLIGKIPIIAKIGFKNGNIELRKDVKTNTKLIKILPEDIVISGINVSKGAVSINKYDKVIAATIHYSAYSINRGLVNNDYLLYFFRSSDFREILYKNLPNGIKTEVKPKHLLPMEVSLPPLSKQKRIVKIIKSIEAKQQQINGLNNAQEREIKNFFYSTYIDLIKDAEFKPMAEVAPLNRRKVKIEPDTIYNEIGVRSFGRGLFEKPSFKGSDLTWQKPYWMKKGDLLFSNIKAWEGALALIGENEDGKVGSHRYITCEPNKEIARGKFLLYQLLLPAGLDQIGLASVGTADRNRTLSTKRLEAIKVPVPKIDKQRKFENSLNQFNQLKEQRKEREKELVQLIPSLLDKAFKGEL